MYLCVQVYYATGKAAGSEKPHFKVFYYCNVALV